MYVNGEMRSSNSLPLDIHSSFMCGRLSVPSRDESYVKGTQLDKKKLV